uniref:peptidylprolyl isomerase n=1 Tax=Gasterosteus aculeatus TaxID=69293 RepID=G3PIA6_GASAC
SPFDQLRQRMNDVLGDGGVLKEVVQSGEGPPVPENASVLNVTLAGLEIGLLTMRKGEFARFLFQPRYAYGSMGCPPLIPPAAVILYEIQILDFLDSGQVDNFLAMSPEEQSTVPLATLLEVVCTLRSFGNRCFNQSRYDNAKDRYKQATMLLGNRETQSAAEMETMETALLPLYLNLSLTELRLDSPRKALKYGNKALEIDSANTKALFRCGQAYMELHEYESAHGYLITAQAKKPFDSDINNLLRKVEICYKDSLDKQKDVYSKMFRGLRGNTANSES